MKTEGKFVLYSSLEEAHKDIAEKNLLSYFSRIARKFHKGSPVKLGVFYYYKGVVYPEGRDWNAEEIFKGPDGWRSFDVVHEDAWVTLINKYTELPNLKWEALPRGRVFYNGHLFVVSFDPSLENEKDFKQEVLSKFNLPPEGTGTSDNRDTMFSSAEVYAHTCPDEIWKGE